MIPIKVDENYCLKLIRQWIKSIGILKNEGIHDDQKGYGFFFQALVKSGTTLTYGVKLDVMFSLDDKYIIFGLHVAEYKNRLYYELSDESPIVKLFQEEFRKINFGDQRPKGKKKTFLKLKKRAFPPGLQPTGNAVNEFLNYSVAHQIPDEWKS